MATLYDLTNEVSALVTSLEADPENADMYIDAFLRSGEVHERVDAYCALIRDLEARVDVRLAEAARLKGLAASDARVAERLKSRLQSFLEAAGRTRLDTDRFSVRVQRCGGTPPVVLSVAPEELPVEYQKVSVAADLAAIARALAEGRPVPGATFGERGRRLVIK